MPLAKIHIDGAAYDESRLQKISNAIRSVVVEVLETPPDDFFQIIFEHPKNRFFHPPSFLGHTYSEEFILLEVTFGGGRTTETRQKVIEELNRRVVADAGIAPDDLVILLFEIAYENISFGQGVVGVGVV